MTLKELEQEEQSLLNMLSENREKQKELHRIEFVKKFGIDIGDTVEWTEGQSLKTGVISKIEYGGVRPYFFHAYLLNADGKVGKREVRIWSSFLHRIKKVTT